MSGKYVVSHRDRFGSWGWDMFTLVYQNKLYPIINSV